MVQSIDYDAAKYGGGVGGSVTVRLRTAIIDFWVRSFLAAHPAGTVVEIGTGLNTRFERVDNGQVHWFDLDLPDTIDLRRNFLRRHRSAPDDSRLRPGRGLAVGRGAAAGGGTFFVADGVLVYLPEDQVTGDAGPDRGAVPRRP